MIFKGKTICEILSQRQHVKSLSYNNEIVNKEYI